MNRPFRDQTFTSSHAWYSRVPGCIFVHTVECKLAVVGCLKEAGALVHHYKTVGVPIPLSLSHLSHLLQSGPSCHHNLWVDIFSFWLVGKYLYFVIFFTIMNPCLRLNKILSNSMTDPSQFRTRRSYDHQILQIMSVRISESGHQKILYN